MINFHKVLISTAIAFTAGFGAWSMWSFLQTGNGWALASAVGFGIAAVVLVIYLINLKRFLAR